MQTQEITHVKYESCLKEKGRKELHFLSGWQWPLDVVLDS